MRVLCLFRTTLIHVILPSVHGQQLVLVKTFNYIKIVKRFAGDGIALFEDYC